MARKPKSEKPSKPAKPAKGGKKGGGKKAAAADAAAPRKPAAAAEVGKSGQARKVISQNNLKVLLQTCAEIKSRADSQNGKLREAVADAVQHQHLNKEVFALIRRLDKKEPEALLLFLEDLEHYLDVSGLNDRADSVGKLPLGAEAPADEGDGEDDDQPTAIQPAGGVSRPAAAANGSGLHTSQAPGGEVVTLPDRGQRAAG